MTTQQPSNDTFDPETVSWILDDDAFETFLVQLEMCSEITTDLETTGLDEHAIRGGISNGGIPARVVMAAFTLAMPYPPGEDEPEPDNWVLPLYHPESPFRNREPELLRRVCETIRTHRKPLDNQNIKFDLRWLYARTWIDLADLVSWDVLTGSHLLDENSSAALKERVPAVFGIERWDDVTLNRPGAALEEPLFKLGLYAVRDTYWSWKLKRLQQAVMFATPDAEEPVTKDEVQEARLGDLHRFVDIPKVQTLTRIEQRGMTLDLEMTFEMIAKAEGIVAERSAQLYELAPVPGAVSWAPTSKWFRAWTEEAVSKDLLTVTSMTKSGNAQWDRHALTRLSRNGFETARLLLDLRESAKQLEFLRSWVEKVNPRTGKIHTTYNVGRTVTGRLSSSGPNMQQVSYALKPCFKASPGKVLIDFDYSQIEMRVAAFVSRSEPLIDAFRTGKDTHTMMASAITHKPLEEITKEERQAGKSANFGLLYDMSPQGFMAYAETAYGVIFTEAEALDTYMAYFRLWEGLSDWHDRMRALVRRDGEVVSPIGRVRRLPGIWGYDPGEAERAAINSPVQGLASDIMQTAGAIIEGVLPGYEGHRIDGAELVGTVHDSIMAEAPEDDWERVRSEITEIMVNTPTALERLGCFFDVPLAADSTVGTRWGVSDVAS